MLPGSSELCEQIILFEMANGLNFPTFMKFLLITITLPNNRTLFFHISLHHDNDSLIVGQYLD